ncbi:MAG: patatin-like phospholipase family protein [Anaerolineales bacterium]
MSASSNYEKTALVLAGGGISGAVYEIGALRAIDDLLIDRTVNDFDIYVGTSAGALVAAFLANGVSPETMLQTIDGSHPQVAQLEPRHVFTINYRDIAKWSLGLPINLLRTWSNYLRRIDKLTLFDLIWSMSDSLPSGMYDGLSLERYVRDTLRALGKSNEFSELDRKLFVVATELESGSRKVFGPGYDANAPISLALAASSALPLLYKPIRIGEQNYVDGSLRGNASLDIAIEQGASLVVCINPLVPTEYSDLPQSDKNKQDRPHTDHFHDIANQILRISNHSGLHYHIKQLRRAHPQVDIILIEPDPQHGDLFSDNLMEYAERIQVARRGFESATLDLAEEYPYYKQVMSRHRIPITSRLVNEELLEIQKSGYDPQVILRVLEARTGACGRRKLDSPVCRLTRVLSELELALEVRYPDQHNLA